MTPIIASFHMRKPPRPSSMRLACIDMRSRVGSRFVRAPTASSFQRVRQWCAGLAAWSLTVRQAEACSLLIPELPRLSRFTADRSKVLPHLNNMRALTGVRAPGLDCPNAAQAGHHQQQEPY